MCVVYTKYVWAERKKVQNIEQKFIRKYVYRYRYLQLMETIN